MCVYITRIYIPVLYQQYLHECIPTIPCECIYTRIIFVVSSVVYRLSYSFLFVCSTIPNIIHNISLIFALLGNVCGVFDVDTPIKKEGNRRKLKPISLKPLGRGNRRRRRRNLEKSRLMNGK